MKIKIKQMHERLRQAREAAGFVTATEAIKRFNWRVSTYRAHENGQNPFRAEEAAAYAKAYGVSPGWLLTGEHVISENLEPANKRRKQPHIRKSDFTPPSKSISYVSIKGVVGSGLWREETLIKEFSLKPSPSLIPADPRYPAEAQYDFKVEGNSLNKFAADGDYVRCVDYEIANIDVTDGDLAIVERLKDDDLIETSAKRLHQVDGLIELHPETDDPQWRHDPWILDPVKGNAENIKLIAKVLWAYRFD